MMTAIEAPCVSIVVPAFNEVETLEHVISNLRDALQNITYEILVVDDGSTDGTAELIGQLDSDRLRLFLHATNRGKGAALRTAFQYVRGRIVVIQDADLEYAPTDILNLIQPILDGHADVVFGLRFYGPAQRVHLFWHRLANNWLTWFSNLVNNLDLSDMETGYKALRREVLDEIHIRENGFGVEPELRKLLGSNAAT